MIDTVAQCIENITGKKPVSEIQGKKILEDFLKSKNYPELGLELRDLIEVSIHYSTLNPTVVLSDSFKKNFDKDGKLKGLNKVPLDIKKNEKDYKRIEEFQTRVEQVFKRYRTFKVLKLTTGLSFSLNGKTIARWEGLFYIGDKVLGGFGFPSDKQIIPLVKESCEEYSFKVLKSKIEEPLNIELVISIVETIIKNFNEKRS